MSLSTEMISKALKLPPDDRAELARKLILSLDPLEMEDGVEEACNLEIDRRLILMDRQPDTLVDWKDSMGRARAAIAKMKPR